MQRPENIIPLDEILKDYFLKPVLVNLSTNREFNLRAYFVGLRIPSGNMVMLYYVKEQHITKYIKHRSKRWIELLPYEYIETIELLPADEETVDALAVAMMQQDIAYRE